MSLSTSNWKLSLGAMAALLIAGKPVHLAHVEVGISDRSLGVSLARQLLLKRQAEPGIAQVVAWRHATRCREITDSSQISINYSGVHTRSFLCVPQPPLQMGGLAVHFPLSLGGTLHNECLSERVRPVRALHTAAIWQLGCLTLPDPVIWS